MGPEAPGRERGALRARERIDRDLRAEASASATRAYRTLLALTGPLPRLDVHYLAFGEGDGPPDHWSPETVKLMERERKRAHRRTQEQLGVRMTDEGGGRFHNDPPVPTAPNSRIRDSVLARSSRT